MFISPEKKFIFLHSRKVAGSSITARLSQEMNDRDIMVGCWPEAYNLGVAFNTPAKKAAKTQFLDYASCSARQFVKGKGWHPTSQEMNRFIKAYYKKRHGFRAGAHSSAAAVRDLTGELWTNAFKFAFVRNPWDHAVSDYYWRKGPKRGVSFKEFLGLLNDPKAENVNRVRPPIITNWTVYAIADEICVDFIGRFETLERDLDHVSGKIGIDLRAGITRAKSTQRDKEKSLRSHYDDEAVDLVSKIYRKEIEAFGYEVPF